MRHWGFIIVMVASLLVIAPGQFAMAQANAAETLIVGQDTTPTGGFLGEPHTDGSWIVWAYSAFSPSDPTTLLSAATIDDRNPRFSAISSGSWDFDAGIVVWSEHPLWSSTPGIHAYDLDTAEQFTLTETFSFDVAIGGRTAFWLTTPEAPYDTIMSCEIPCSDAPTNLYDVLKGTEIYGMQAEGDRLFWSQRTISRSSWNIMTMAIGETEPTWLVTESREFTVAGSIMVYSSANNDELVALNLVTGASQRVAATSPTSFTTDGRYVFWTDQDPQAPEDSRPLELYGYDLETASSFVVAGYPRQDPLTSTGPMVGDAAVGMLVWSVQVWGKELDDPFYYLPKRSEIHAAPIVDRLPSARQADPDTTDPNWTWYPETGHYLGGAFRDFWEANGGLPVFGYPLTSEYLERDHTTQFTERQRFEWHPNNRPPYQVLLGRLGDELLTQQGRDWTTFPPADPSTPHYQPETGHAIAPEFWGYWSSHGLAFGDPGVSFRESLALFGFPLSEPMLETNADGDTVLTQYFERAVFEHHPENAEPYRVLLRRLGAEALVARGWLPN